MAEDAKIIIDVDVETKKVENELDKVLNEYSNKKIELDLQLKDQSYLRRQLKALDDQIKSIDGKPPTNLTSAFNKLKEEFSQSIIKTTELKNQLNSLSKEYRTLYSELQKVSNASPLDNIKNSFSNFGKILSNISSSVSNIFGRITNSFKNFNFHAINSSRHVDYFGRRIFNLLRNAFVFNVISRQFRGLSSLLGNLVHRDIYFAKSLMIVKANLVRAFAPIWQIILPWIRALGDGLVWISNQLIKFINFLTGSKIKPLQGFQEAKQVVDDFKRIASPTRDLFDLKDPDKQARELKKNIKDTQDESYRTAKNAERLAKRLKASQQQSTKLLAKFDKLEVLKFKKIKNPLDDISNVSKNKGLDIPVKFPSIEDQIDNAINNIKDKPLKFNVGSDLGENITSEINGLKLKALDFEVDEESQRKLEEFKEKIKKFIDWITPLTQSIKNFFVSLGNSFKRLFDDLNNNGTFQKVSGWFGNLKDKLTNFFNTISQNKNAMDNLRNLIIGIGVAFVTYKIVSRVIALALGIGKIVAFLATNPIGWFLLIVAGISLVALNWDKIKEKFPTLATTIEDVCKTCKEKLGDLGKEIKKDIGDALKWVSDQGEKIMKWLNDNPDVLYRLTNLVNVFVDLIKWTYELLKLIVKFGAGFFEKVVLPTVGNFWKGLFGNSQKLPDITPLILPKGVRKLPGLAQGSVLKGGDPFLAYLNDQPRGQTNIEAPLSTIVDAFKQAINESNYNNQPDITINASGDMSSFIRMLNFKLQDENNRLGGSFVDTSSF